MFDNSQLTTHNSQKIGILDSGVGGLSVYLPLRAALGNVDMVYLADTAFAPYGTKSHEQLLSRLYAVVGWLAAHHQVKLVVLACNTATVNGLAELRRTFPSLTFVGMEPAVKPAAEATDRIIVLGTNSTVTNPRYHDLVTRVIDPDRESAQHEHLDDSTDVTRFGSKTIWHVGANELVAQVEAGRLTDTTILEQKLQVSVREPESLVIGCSHFSFLKSTIEKRWPELQIFDGADGVVAQTRKIVLNHDLSIGSGRTDFMTTGPDRTIRFLAPPINFRHMEI